MQIVPLAGGEHGSIKVRERLLFLLVDGLKMKRLILQTSYRKSGNYYKLVAIREIALDNYKNIPVDWFDNMKGRELYVFQLKEENIREEK